MLHIKYKKKMAPIYSPILRKQKLLSYLKESRSFNKGEIA